MKKVGDSKGPAVWKRDIFEHFSNLNRVHPELVKDNDEMITQVVENFNFDHFVGILDNIISKKRNINGN